MRADVFAPNAQRIRKGIIGSDDSCGMNGMFVFHRKYGNGSTTQIACMVSDGETNGWEHVSVTVDRDRCPTWEEMCFVKSIFFEDDETAVQFHPKASEYVNNHPYCLHLWRNKNFEYQLPPTDLVGIKT